MYLFTHSRDVARETAERAWRAPIGWMSPFWLSYGAAVSAGAAWWWMNQLSRPANLEAAHGDAAVAAAKLQEAAALQETAQRSADAPIRPVEPVSQSKGVEAKAVIAPTIAETPDDLTRLVGVGPRLSAALAQRGVTRFAQIAAWTDQEIAELDRALSLKGCVSRHAWVAQARRFASQEV